MIRSILKIRGDGYYSTEITSTIPVRVSIHAIHQYTGLGLVSATKTEDIEEYINMLGMTEVIEEVEITFKSPTVYWTKVRQRNQDYGIHPRILDSDSMNEFPIVITHGWQYHQVLSPNGKAFGKMLDNLKEEFVVEILQSSKSTDPKNSLLTEKQYQALITAYNMGYYDLPRRVTFGTIAGEVGVSRSALQERIHRAEAKLVQQYSHNSLFET